MIPTTLAGQKVEARKWHKDEPNAVPYPEFRNGRTVSRVDTSSHDKKFQHPYELPNGR